MHRQHERQQNQFRANQTRIAGEFETREGETAYRASGWRIHGFFCMFDKSQSFFTGVAITEEATRIRRSERLTAQANPIEQNNQNQVNPQQNKTTYG